MGVGDGQQTELVGEWTSRGKVGVGGGKMRTTGQGMSGNRIKCVRGKPFLRCHGAAVGVPTPVGVVDRFFYTVGRHTSSAHGAAFAKNAVYPHPYHIGRWLLAGEP